MSQHWTDEQWAAVWNDPTPGLPGARHYFIDKTPDGIAAAHDYGPTTFGITLEHVKVGGLAGERCTVYIIDSTRSRDVGFDANNTITVNVQGTSTGTIDCKDCDLLGRIRRSAWEPL